MRGRRDIQAENDVFFTLFTGYRRVRSVSRLVSYLRVRGSIFFVVKIGFFKSDAQIEIGSRARSWGLGVL